MKAFIKWRVLLLCFLELVLGVTLFCGRFYDTTLAVSLSKQMREPSVAHLHELNEAKARLGWEMTVFNGIIILMMAVGLVLIWYSLSLRGKHREN